MKQAAPRSILHTLLPLLLISLLVLGAAASLAVGGQAAVPDRSPAAETVQIPAAVEPGNYCASCHAAGDPRLSGVTAWHGEIAAAGISPCPAAKQIREELFYTERMLLAIDRYHAGLPGFIDTTGIDSRLEAGRQSYQRLLDAPVTGLDAFVAEAQAVRFKLGKVYSAVQVLDESAKRLRSLIAAIIVTLIVLGSLVWGLYHTRHVGRQASVSGWKNLARFGLLLLMIAAFFSLPLLRLPPQADAASDPEAQAVQTELDTVQRAAAAADRALARSWMIGQVGAAWNDLDTDQAAEIFEQAVAAAEEARSDSSALWGEASAAHEAAVSDPAVLEKASLIAAQVGSTRSRAWMLALIGESWLESDAEAARTALTKAEQTALDGRGVYRDLDLRRIALAWRQLAPKESLRIAGLILDPEVRAAALVALAQAGSRDALDAAAAEVPALSGSTQKALLAADLARLTDDGRFIEIALAAADLYEGTQQAYLYAGIASRSADPSIAEKIAPDFPGAQALAWLNAGDASRAWEAAARIADPFERDRARIEATKLLAQTDPNQAEAKIVEIESPLLRDRATRFVIQISGDASLVSQVENTYDRVMALTSLDQWDQAEKAAVDLKETYPLVGLAEALASLEPQRALNLIDKIQRETDKAQALSAVSLADPSKENFERALAMAAAARIRGDTLAPVRATLNLARSFFHINRDQAGQALLQALDLAERISVK